MEILSLLTSMLSIYCGLFFISDVSSRSSDQEKQEGEMVLNEHTKIFFFAVILISNLCFFLYWGIMMYLEIKNMLRSKFSKLYLFCCLCGNMRRLDKEKEN